MYKYFLPLLLVICTATQLRAQFTVSDNKRFILKDGQPFFWLGDTAWELFHRLNREDADKYLKRRSEQGFTVIQAVALAEFNGLNEPNAYGQTPLIDNDPSKPNEKYFEHVDYIINKAGEYHLNIGLLPTWGDKVNKDRWGIGPEIFNEKNAAVYAGWLATRYKNKTNIIWILGGDRKPRGEADLKVWRAMANAIEKAIGKKALITFHTQPNELGSAEWFAKDEWFDFDMFQTGHCRDNDVYNKIQAAYHLQPVKPVIDGEPIYEDHPVCFNAKDLGTSSAYDVRKSAYLDLFAGAFGHTYGCHDIWQMYSPEREPVNGAHYFWYDAMELPGANQMTHVKKLMTAFDILSRIPDQSLIKENNNVAAERIQATRGDGYALIYTAAGRPVTVLPGKLKGSNFNCSWFDPRTGKSTDAGSFDNVSEHQFKPPSAGYGKDWVLVLKSAG
jgi:hypothetical protein